MTTLTKKIKSAKKKEVRKTIESKLKTVIQEINGDVQGKRLEKKIKKAGKILASGVKKQKAVKKPISKIIKPKK